MDALREVARLGPFFTLAPDPEAPGWRPLAELAEPAALRERVGTACAFLAERFRVPPADIDERAVASMQFLGTAARLVSPVLATAVVHGVQPAEAEIGWRPAEGGRVEFALRAREETSDAGPAGYERLVLRGPVARIEDAVRAEFALSHHVTRGNIASALAGAATVLGTGSPQHAAPAAAFVRALLAAPYLRGYGSWPETGRFRRANCCLFYRLPGAGKCGDCVLLELNRS